MYSLPTTPKALTATATAGTPTEYTDPSGDAFVVDDVAEIIIGGVLNVVINANRIDNLWEGIGYFAVGGLSTWVTCQTFGAAAPIGGAISGFGNALLETDFLTKENGYSFKSIRKEQWGNIAIKTAISTGASFLGNWAGDKISAGITNKFNIQSEFWNKAINQMSVNGITTSLEMYGESTLIDGNKWNSKEVLGRLGIGLGAGMLTGFTQTYLLDKWAMPELQKMEGMKKGIVLNESNWWSNAIRNSYNPLITPMPTIMPPPPTRFFPSNNILN
jgi:hypothetical protein